MEDEDIFYRQCKALEDKVPNIVKDGNLLTDVDGTLIQMYALDGLRIQVINDRFIPPGEVCIESEIDLEQFFK